jgi:chaperonin GroES|tara:strand:+ start:471 stop:770 length:300 start_codon:yes stop_codon:yes gene_type:complete
MTIQFKPLSNYVLIDYGEAKKAEDKTKGGIILTTNERPQQGTVVACGKGRKHGDGVRSPMTVKVGDEVKFAHMSGREIKVEGKDYFLMPETDIQGILEK